MAHMHTVLPAFAGLGLMWLCWMFLVLWHLAEACSKSRLITPSACFPCFPILGSNHSPHREGLESRFEGAKFRSLISTKRLLSVAILM